MVWYGIPELLLSIYNLDPNQPPNQQHTTTTILIWQQVRRRGGARIRWRQMSSLDQRGHLNCIFSNTICMCVPMCDISILFDCYVTTLTPLYVRPLNQQTTNHKQ